MVRSGALTNRADRYTKFVDDQRAARKATRPQAMATRNPVRPSYEREIERLQDQFVEQDGSYYFEEALVRQRHGVELSDNNKHALRWWQAQVEQDKTTEGF
jgi:hypothetical protein